MHGEGYDPEMEARIFAEASTSGRESEKTDGDVDPSTVGFGNLRDTMALRQKQRAPPRRRKAERARRRARRPTRRTTRTTSEGRPRPDDDASLRRGNLALGRGRRQTNRRRNTNRRWKTNRRITTNRRVHSPSSRTPSPMPLERLAEAAGPARRTQKQKPLSLQPLDLGDPIRYEELRRALGVEESLSRSLDEILAPVDALPRYTSKRHNLFTPFATCPRRSCCRTPYSVRPTEAPTGEGTKENGEGTTRTRGRRDAENVREGATKWDTAEANTMVYSSPVAPPIRRRSRRLPPPPAATRRLPLVCRSCSYRSSA